jgi:hypothetical protein
MDQVPLRIECVDDQVAAILRAKTPTERLEIAHRMWSHASRFLTRVLEAEHPEWESLQVQREVARRMSHGAV